MSRFRMFLLEFLINAASWTLLYSIISVPLYYFNGPWDAYMGMLTALPFIAAMFVRRHVKNLVLFSVIHLLILVWAVVIDFPMAQKIIYLIFSITLIIYSFTKKFKQNEDSLGFSFLIFNICVLIALTFAAQSLNITQINNLLAASTIIIFICYMLYNHISNIDYSLQIITSNTIQPVKSIISFNNKIVAFFLIITAVVAGFSKYYRIDQLIITISRVLLAGIRFLFSLTGSGEPEVLEEIPEELPVEQAESGFMFMEPGEPAIFWVILETLVYYIVMIVLFAAIIGLIGYSIYMLYKKFYGSKREDGDTKEFIQPDIFISPVSILNSLKGYIPFFGQTASGRIRRLFYKRVRKQMSKGFEMRASYTANEISGIIKEKDDLSELTPLYEKARYSNKELTNDEIRNS